MNKNRLAYWLALNDQLEREVHENPNSAKELTADIKRLEARLDKESIKRAKENSKSRMYTLMVSNKETE